MSTAVYAPSPSGKQKVRLHLVDANIDISRWISYSFSSSFLTPSDGWSFTTGGDQIPEAEQRAMRLGARVDLYIDDFPLASGYIDRIELNADRSSGTTVQIQGRDRLAPVVDSVADPRLQFKTGTTLEEFLKTLLAPYGWSSDEHFVLDNATNRDAKTGGVRGDPEPKRKSKTGKLSKYQIYQLKPHNHEGLFRFINRTVERFGLFVRVSADGRQIIVAGPDFDQAPRYRLIRNNKGQTSILSGSVTFDATDQPSVIIADGKSGGGEFGKGRIKSYCVNPYFGLDENSFIADDVSKILEKYPEARPIMFHTEYFQWRAPRVPPRPLFLHDEESKTQSQLDYFVMRTMSEFVRRSLVCNYTVEGHGQMINGSFVPWDVDTVVDVQDDVGGIHEPMYVLGRTFEKSRSGGTTTRLQLVRLYSIAVAKQEGEGEGKKGGEESNLNFNFKWRPKAPSFPFR